MSALASSNCTHHVIANESPLFYPRVVALMAAVYAQAWIDHIIFPAYISLLCHPLKVSLEIQ